MKSTVTTGIILGLLISLTIISYIVAIVSFIYFVPAIIFMMSDTILITLSVITCALFLAAMFIDYIKYISHKSTNFTDIQEQDE